MVDAAKQERPLTRMVNHMAQQIETLETCYAVAGEKGALEWKSEIAKARHAMATEIFKTLTLVEAFEPDFKAILRKKMPRKSAAQ